MLHRSGRVLTVHCICSDARVSMTHCVCREAIVYAEENVPELDLWKPIANMPRKRYGYLSAVVNGFFM